MYVLISISYIAGRERKGLYTDTLPSFVSYDMFFFFRSVYYFFCAPAMLANTFALATASTYLFVSVLSR